MSIPSMRRLAARPAEARRAGGQPRPLRPLHFGFTTCPDVCPTDLACITAALQSLGSDAERIATVLRAHIARPAR